MEIQMRMGQPLFPWLDFLPRIIAADFLVPFTSNERD